MGRRHDHNREQIRELTIQAATQIIIEQGLSGLSTRKIAAVIGYTAGSLYLVFENLDELILQVNARTLDELYSALNTVESAKIFPPETYLLTLGHTYLHFALDHPKRWCAIFEHHLPTGIEIPDWYQEKIWNLFNIVERPLQQFLPTQEAQTCIQAARALWCGVHGVCILALTHKLDVVGVHSVQSLLDILITNYLKGLAN